MGTGTECPTQRDATVGRKSYQQSTAATKAIQSLDTTPSKTRPIQIIAKWKAHVKFMKTWTCLEAKVVRDPNTASHGFCNATQ